MKVVIFFISFWLHGGKSYGGYYNYYYSSGKTTQPPPPKKCPPGWFMYPGPVPVCIYKSPDKVDWPTAAARCQSMGAILAEPRTKSEMVFSAIHENSFRTFVGIKVDMSKCRAFYVSTGLPASLGLWQPSGPNKFYCGGKHECAYIIHKSHMSNNPYTCYSHMNFACQRPL